MKLHANRGHASAEQITQEWADSERGNPHLLDHVGGFLQRRERQRAVDRAPHVPIARTPSVSTFNEKLLIDPLFLDDAIALHNMDVSS